MTFSEWLRNEAKSNREIHDFIQLSLPAIEWPSEKLNLLDVVNQLKDNQMDFGIWSNILKYWALYLKHESNSRTISANEIREIREVLVSILSWIQLQAIELDMSENAIIAEAETQIANLEEKEVEIRYLQHMLN